MKTKNEWLDDMELRLKRALLDVMDLPEEEGKIFLQQELRSHLEDVSGDGSKLDYLNSLKERFPQMSSASKTSNFATARDADAAEPASIEVAGSRSAREVNVEEALAIVKRDWEQLSEEDRLEFIKEHMPEELVSRTPKDDSSSSTGSFIKNPSEELARFLKLPAESEISSERLQTALVSLLKTVSQVDALSTQVYKQVGLSRDLNAEDIRKLVGDYVGTNSVDLKHLNQILDETRLKVGLIISSIADMSTSLSQTHLSKFQPSMIEQSVGSSGGGFLANDLIVKQLKKLKRR